MPALRFQLASQIRTLSRKADLSLWAVSVSLHAGHAASARAGEGQNLALELYLEGLGLSAISRVLSTKLETVYGWVKNVRVGAGTQRELSRRRALRGHGQGAARALSFDEMWAYVGARRKGKRRSVWIWTAVVEETDSGRWMDYEVGGRDEGTFLKLYGRLPDAKKYRSDDYNMYGWLPADRHVVGKSSKVHDGTPQSIRETDILTQVFLGS